MPISLDKGRRLEKVARLYYEEGLTQDEIARDLKVSRPLISRLIREARDLGIGKYASIRQPTVKARFA